MRPNSAATAAPLVRQAFPIGRTSPAVGRPRQKAADRMTTGAMDRLGDLARVGGNASALQAPLNAAQSAARSATAPVSAAITNAGILASRSVALSPTHVGGARRSLVEVQSSGQRRRGGSARPLRNDLTAAASAVVGRFARKAPAVDRPPQRGRLNRAGPALPMIRPEIRSDRSSIQDAQGIVTPPQKWVGGMGSPCCNISRLPSRRAVF